MQVTRLTRPENMGIDRCFASDDPVMKFAKLISRHFPPASKSPLRAYTISRYAYRYAVDLDASW